MQALEDVEDLFGVRLIEPDSIIGKGKVAVVWRLLQHLMFCNFRRGYDCGFDFQLEPLPVRNEFEGIRDQVAEQLIHLNWDCVNCGHPVVLDRTIFLCYQ